MRADRRNWRVLRALLACVVLLVMLFPLYWMVIASTNRPDELLSRVLLPQHPSLDAYAAVLAQPFFWLYARNSLLIASGVCVGSVGVSALAAYALARLPFAGSKWISRFILFAYIVPPVLLVVPMFVVLSRVGLVNTPLGLVIAEMAFAVPFCTWLLRGFFLSLPPELEDAALVDGCTQFGAFRHVVLPLARPGLVAAGMFAFLIAWNDYLYPTVFLRSESQYTLPVGIQVRFFVADMTPDYWVQLLAASFMAAIPVLLLFIGLQRWMVSGLSAGSVKG